MSPELSQLIELQELDIEIQRTSDRLLRIPEERDRTETEFKQHAAEFLDLKSKHERTLEDRKQLEAELATTQQNHEKFERDRLGSNRERIYRSLREMTQLGNISPGDGHTQADGGDRAIDDELASGRPKWSGCEKLDVLWVRWKRTLETTRLCEFGAPEKARRYGAEHIFRTTNACRDRPGTTPRRGSRTGYAKLPVRVRQRYQRRSQGRQWIICENCGRILYYRNEPTSAEAATLTRGAERYV